MKTAERNSSFELVKVIAIICIIFCHSIPTGRIECGVATQDFWLWGVTLFRQMGSIGNAIFMVASSWFLVEIDKTDLSKISKILSDNQVISVIFLIIFAWGGNYRDISAKMAIKQVFPFMFSVLWYVTCYIMVYCVHGFINKALSYSKVDTKRALLVLTILSLYYYAFGGLYYSEFVGFLVIYVYTWYLKKAIENWNQAKIKKVGYVATLVGILGWFLGAAVFNLVGCHIQFVGARYQMWNRFSNPFMLFIAFGSMFIASTCAYKSQTVNTISKLSLFVYMITGNQLIRTYFDNDIYDSVALGFGSSMKVAFVFTICYAVLKLLVGIILAELYRLSLGRITEKLANKRCRLIQRISGDCIKEGD